MNKEEAAIFLFTIANEIKRSFESPVILLTMKDYADCIFNSLMDMRAALLQNATPERVVEIVSTFHFEWLQAVQDIEYFKKRAKEIPRDTVVKAIDYTIQCVGKRYKYFQAYIDNVNKTITNTERALIQSDLEIIYDMREIINYALIEKQKCFSFSIDKKDFHVILSDEIEELLNWLDMLNDNLAIQFSKVLDLKVPLLPKDLTKTLQQIIDEVANLATPEARKIAEELGCKGRRLGSVARIVSSIKDIEISKIVEKIKELELRINRLKHEKSSAIMALQHKAMYLEERLESLENLKLSLNLLKDQNETEQEEEAKSDDKSSEYENIRIFNHLLPHQERCRLVEKLVKLWESAIAGDRKSIISILSVADMKEVFCDDLGRFTVDKYGRKIYTINDNDEDLYQLNGHNELVRVKDDEHHVYFYDECGRYYLDDNRDRVYKAHPNASEYILHRPGIMLKFAEIENGIEYRYDNLGRHYVDDDGNRIYREKGSTDEYRPDGLGNLVRVRTDDPVYETCPFDAIMTADSMYLKQVIGTALKKCLAEVILVQPEDPIKYLAGCLEKYRYNIEAKQNKLRQEQELFAQRDLMRSKSESISLFGVVGEESVTDYNFTAYETQINI